jgi:hypothetical protein
MPATPASSRCGDVLGRGKVLLHAVVVHWTVALRRHNRGCADGVAALVSF